MVDRISMGSVNARSLHIFVIPLHLVIPLGDYYIEYCYRMLGVERNRPSKVAVTYWYSFLPREASGNS